MLPASPGVAEREKSKRVTVAKKEAEKRRKEKGYRYGETEKQNDEGGKAGE